MFSDYRCLDSPSVSPPLSGVLPGTGRTRDSGRRPEGGRGGTRVGSGSEDQLPEVVEVSAEVEEKSQAPEVSSRPLSIHERDPAVQHTYPLVRVHLQTGVLLEAVESGLRDRYASLPKVTDLCSDRADGEGSGRLVHRRFGGGRVSLSQVRWVWDPEVQHHRCYTEFKKRSLHSVPRGCDYPSFSHWGFSCGISFDMVAGRMD